MRRRHVAIAQLFASIVLGFLYWALLSGQESHDMLLDEGTTNDAPRPKPGIKNVVFGMTTVQTLSLFLLSLTHTHIFRMTTVHTYMYIVYICKHLHS